MPVDNIRWRMMEWVLEHTGGDCTAYKREEHGHEYLLTAMDPRAPEPGETAFLHRDGQQIEIIETWWPDCEGCDTIMPDIKPYLVTFHDDSQCKVLYCDDCADLARMDWNGETASIEPLDGSGGVVSATGLALEQTRDLTAEG